MATILNEIAKAANVGVLAVEDEIPRSARKSAAPPSCWGSTPCTSPARATSVAVITGSEQADRAVAALRARTRSRRQAAVIGHVRGEQPGIVQLKT